MICWYMLSIETVTSAPLLEHLAPRSAGLRSLRLSREDRLHLLDALDQGVDLVHRGVHTERRSRGRRYSVPHADRTSAVMTGAHGDALLVEQLRDVVRMNALERKGDRGATVDGGGRPDDAQVRDRLQTLERVGGERLLVLADLGHAERGHPVDGRAERDGLRDHRRAGLEA